MTESAAGLSIGDIEVRILEFRRRELLAPETTIERDDDLLTGEVLDSIGALRLAAFVEKEFHVDLHSSGFVVENFQSVAVLADYVRGSVESAEQSTPAGLKE
jgi:acyl carrier protein